MNIETLLGDKLKASIENIRTSSEFYEELVFLIEDSSELHDSIISKLGAEIKSASDNPESGMTAPAINIAETNGGIDENQFLYGGIVDSIKIVIMIWPWQDNEHLTIKKFII